MDTALPSPAEHGGVQSRLQAVLDELLRVEGLNPVFRKSAALAQQDVSRLLEAWAEGDVSALGPYGAQLLDSVHASDAMRASLASLKAQSFPLFDGTGRVGRYLAMIGRTLESRGIQMPTAILFAEYPTHRFNASVVSTSHGDLCLMNTGLLQLLYHLSVAANHAYDDDGRLGAIDSEPMKVAAVLALAVVTQYLGAGDHIHVKAEGRHLPSEALYDATALAYSMRLFVLAHEVGHIVLGHTQVADSSARVQALEDAAVISRRHEDELDADRFAQDVLLDIDRHRLFSEPVACGGLGFLLVHAIIQEVAAKLSGAPAGSRANAESHPPTLMRIKKLDEYLDAGYGEGSREALARCVVLQRLLIAIQSVDIVPAAHAVQLAPVPR